MFKIFLSRNGSEPTDVTYLLSLWGCDTGSEVKIISRVGSFRNLTGQMIKTRTGSPFIIPGLTNENPLKPGLTPAWRSGDVPALLWTSVRARVCDKEQTHTALPRQRAGGGTEVTLFHVSLLIKDSFHFAPSFKTPRPTPLFHIFSTFSPLPVNLGAKKMKNTRLGPSRCRITK